MEVVFTTRRMPHTTQLWRMHRAIEDVYYLTLFSNASAYVDEPAVWQSWLGMGFSVGLREPPPGARSGDRVRTSVRSDGKTLTVTAAGGDAAALDRSASILRRVEELRSSANGHDDARVDAVLRDEFLAAELLTPLREAMGRAALAPERADPFVDLVRRDLESLLYPDITTMAVVAP
jgi:hypothetical protein